MLLKVRPGIIRTGDASTTWGTEVAVMPDNQRLTRLSRRIQALVWVVGTVSVGASVLRWLVADTRAALPPTLAALMPAGPLGFERRLAGFSVELIPLAAALYVLVVLHRICAEYAQGELFGARMGKRYRAFGRGLLLLGLANGLYTALITIVLTYVPGTTRLAIPLGLSTADLYLMVVGVAVVMLGGVMDEAHRIQDENANIV